MRKRIAEIQRHLDRLSAQKTKEKVSAPSREVEDYREIIRKELLRIQNNK